jgi:MtrB/PioB family decaheme-associated outer membrane protein
MKSRIKFLLTCVTGILVIGAGPMISTSHAADTAMPTKAMPAAEPVPFWWFHGEVEFGGRVFLNDPQKDGLASQGGKSLSKYYEYSDNKPGPFLNGHLSTGTSNGLYQFDLWAKNVGYNDQRFNVDASKAGEHYFNFQWDQTPHNYGTGQTIYNGAGTTSLTLPPGLSAALFSDCGSPCTANLTVGQAAAVRTLLNANLHSVDIGIRRDTASVGYRWTPTDAWDISVNYDHMHRWGTQVDGIVFAPTPSGPVSQVPKPVNDTTQNFGVNGEYVGTSPWNQKFNFKVGYAGSVYQDASSSYTAEDPFCPATAGAIDCARAGAHTAQMSLWPDNQANGFNATLGADLPMKSRYMGTVSYNMMRQNQQFLPFTNNTGLAFLINGQNPSSLAALPAQSLNGAVNTLLSNNVLTTQITPELKSKLMYRYYDYQNDTPELYFSNWVLTDSRSAGTTASYAPVHSISPAYTKQDGTAQLDWRPINSVNLGAAYLFERYDWTRADANVTNENSGKVFADWKPWVWLTARASWQSGERRYDNYDYLAYLGNFQWVNGPGSNTQQSTAMRQFFLNDRDQNKGQFSVSVDLVHGLTVTPTFGYQDDVYKIASTEVGLTRSTSVRAGVDVSYMVNPATALTFSYMNEQYLQNLRSTGMTSTSALTAATTYSSPVRDRINTLMAGINYWAIPDQLNLDLRYTVMLATDHQAVYFDNGTQPGSGANYSQYPDVRSMWQRVEATAKYKFDKEIVQRLGWNGDVYAKLRYAWERNSVDNWQNDMMQTYMYSAAAPGTSYGLLTWLAYDNPNYNVQLLMASITMKW